MKMVALRCPECGANLEVEEGRQFTFCQYCGTKIALQNENEYTYRHIDEAGVKQAETDRIVKLKQLELDERKRQDEEKAATLRMKSILYLAGIGLALMIVGGLIGAATGDDDSPFYFISMIGMISTGMAAYVWVNGRNKKEDSEGLDNNVKVPTTIYGFQSKNYKAIETLFTSAGFINVKCVPLNDLSVGIFKKPGMVESITINGQEISEGGKKFSPNAAVIISYHCYADK